MVKIEMMVKTLWDGYGQKWVWPVWWLDSKNFCIKLIVEQTDFLHVDIDLRKLIADQKFFGWAWSKMGVTSLVTGL